MSCQVCQSPRAAPSAGMRGRRERCRITSWLTLLLRRLPVKQQLVKKHTRAKLECWTVTSNGVSKLDLDTNFSLTVSQTTQNRICDGRFSRQNDDIPWLKKQSTIPSTLSLQPSESTGTGATTPSMTPRRQMRSYQKDGLNKAVDQALPVCVIRLILSNRTTEPQCTMGDLVAAAHLWAMRSCKYQNPSSDRQSSFAFETLPLPLSKMAISLIIFLPQFAVG